MHTDYLAAAIAGIERGAGVPVVDAAATLDHVCTPLRYTAEQQARILAHVIDGGQRTSGGVLHAVTSTAQTLTDADTAYDMNAPACA